MLERLIIYDSSGQPFYARTFHGSSIEDSSLLSGLIAAIQSFGRSLNAKKFATLTYGEDDVTTLGEPVRKIVIMSKDLFTQDESLNFVFLTSGECHLKVLREIVTTIYMEIKTLLRSPLPDYKKIQAITDKYLDNYKGLENC
jgi:hypothetical protein